MPETTEDNGIAVCLGFDGQAEAAVGHCLAAFGDGRVTQTFRPRPDALAPTGGGSQ